MAINNGNADKPNGETDSPVYGNEDFTNSLGMAFNYIEPGTFMMGSPAMNFFHVRMSTDSRAVAVGLRSEDLRSAGSETPALLPKLEVN